jgi:hypothetical protein
MAEHHVAAMARAEDLLLIRTESLRFPLLVERTSRNRGQRTFTGGSCEPNLDEDGHEHRRQSGPNKEDFFHTIVADYRNIVVHVRIAIEKLVPSSEDEDSGKQENSDSNAKGNAQRRDANLFNYGDERNYLITDQHVRLRFLMARQERSRAGHVARLGVTRFRR